MGGSLSSSLQPPGVRITPVIYAFTFTSIAYLIKYLAQEIFMMVMKKKKEEEPVTFEDIKRTKLDDLPKDLNSKRTVFERLRRVKKEDFEFLMIYFFIAFPFLIFTDASVASNYVSSEKSIGWSDLSIANSVIGCFLISTIAILRAVSTGLIFFVSKESVTDVMKNVTIAFLGLFALHSLVMIFIYNYVPRDEGLKV